MPALGTVGMQVATIHAPTGAAHGGPCDLTGKRNRSYIQGTVTTRREQRPLTGETPR